MLDDGQKSSAMFRWAVEPHPITDHEQLIQPLSSYRNYILIVLLKIKTTIEVTKHFTFGIGIETLFIQRIHNKKLQIEFYRLRTDFETIDLHECGLGSIDTEMR